METNTYSEEQVKSWAEGILNCKEMLKGIRYKRYSRFPTEHLVSLITVTLARIENYYPRNPYLKAYVELDPTLGYTGELPKNWETEWPSEIYKSIVAFDKEVKAGL